MFGNRPRTLEDTLYDARRDLVNGDMQDAFANINEALPQIVKGPLKDAIERLMAHTRFSHESMMNSGSETLEEFNWTMTAQNIHELSEALWQQIQLVGSFRKTK